MLRKIIDGFYYGLGAALALMVVALVFNSLYFALIGLMLQIGGTKV